ncbi:TPA: hypothetical protein N0F65_006418 [Lagenidium giganteum]|uniref:C2H2-type domain-containing protein n=1 Tax=Lagenidium giganteum TaxID=4803 RepID=A0AAV2Z4P6_9STRA|nr:TPA: hypothetical protein N0F65_006418 [Lagenidium giganteum]
MFTCTACRLSFDTPAGQKEHFRSDWHRYNLKRKVVELPPVTEEQFNARMAKVVQEQQARQQNDPKQKQLQKREEIKKSGVKTMTKCVACKKTFTSDNAYENHLASKKHIGNAKKNPAMGDAVETIAKKVELVSVDDKEAQEQEDAAAEDGAVGETMSLEEYKKTVPLAKEDCIFCSHHAEDFDSCLNHMLKEHGFFIPDVECLVDIEGLVGYLAGKVKLGHFCLYCNGKGKTFRSYQDVQKHMTALSHCKILYEEDDDLEELLDFYDFSKQYENAKAAEGDAEEAEWETDSEASIDDDEEVVEEEVDEEEDEDDNTNTIEVSETGELVLASGRRIGRREFRRYYKQRFRPEENRESVLAATKERLLLAYQTAGVDTSAGTTALSTAFVANFMRRRNNIAGGNTIVAAQRQRNFIEKHRGRLDFRSHKLQKNPNRRAMVTV